MRIIALFLLSLTCARAESGPCDSINSLYNSCAPRFRFDSRTFDFSFGRERAQVACSDGRELPYFDRLEQMDIASIFLFPYVAGTVPLPETRRNWDPGRLRSEPLFKSVFGADEDSVRGNLVPVPFLGQTIKFQKRLGAAAALKRVSEELLAAAALDPSLKKFLEPFTGKKEDLRNYGFFWRNVKGTNRLSSHSFGTAIDLLTNVGPEYWLWDEQRLHPDKAKLGENAYRNDHYIPPGAPIFHAKAVEIFERNGFIWGGKWNHYDSMHFEYRPEFFAGVKIDCGGERALLAPALGSGFSASFPAEEAPLDFGPDEIDH